LYTSSAINSRKYTTSWSTAKWVDLVRFLYRFIPNINIIWIGAKYDKDMYDILKRFYKKMPYFVDREPGFVMTLLRSCDAFISFQSGLSVLSVCESIPTAMFYFDALDKLRHSWCPPGSINNESLYYCPMFKQIISNPKGLRKVVDWTKDVVYKTK
jgi:ADP-heptose:LPS heptosyltransferase